MSDLENQEFKNKKLSSEWGVWGEKNTLTPRKLLQIIGTEAGRKLIHPDIWVNSLFSSYKEGLNWVITDVRFKNEAQIIKNKGGILIKITREELLSNSTPHISETALDNYKD